jgi:hypothetical protein
MVIQKGEVQVYFIWLRTKTRFNTTFTEKILHKNNSQNLLYIHQVVPLLNQCYINILLRTKDEILPSM